MSKGTQKKVEYGLYYGLIFIAALPFAAGFWVYRMVRPNPARQNLGVVKRAKEQASMVTPMIFSA